MLQTRRKVIVFFKKKKNVGPLALYRKVFKIYIYFNEDDVRHATLDMGPNIIHFLLAASC